MSSLEKMSKPWLWQQQQNDVISSHKNHHGKIILHIYIDQEYETSL